MVIVTMPAAVLSWESCTCMGKVKMPAWVGVPVRTLSRSGASRTEGDAGRELIDVGDDGPVRSRAAKGDEVVAVRRATGSVASGVVLICSVGSTVRLNR
jgi:hypothetical protein